VNPADIKEWSLKTRQSWAKNDAELKKTLTKAGEALGKGPFNFECDYVPAQKAIADAGNKWAESMGGVVANNIKSFGNMIVALAKDALNKSAILEKATAHTIVFRIAEGHPNSIALEAGKFVLSVDTKTFGNISIFQDKKKLVAIL